MKGTFISLEGGEGAGKSSQMRRIRQWLEQHGHVVVEAREPGGTPLSELIRDVVLHGEHPEMCATTELMLMFAARAQLVAELILPTLAEGHSILSDRFTDASYAYQGGGRGLPTEHIEALEQVAMGELRPDLTLLLDLPVNQGMERTQGRGSEDRFETETTAFLQRARDTYLARAQAYPQRFEVIDASADEATVWRAIRTVLEVRYS